MIDSRWRMRVRATATYADEAHARMSRPRGEVREALRAAMKAGPGTTRELAQRSGVGVTASMRTLDNMVTAGEVQKQQPTRRPGVKRPVPVYALAEPRQPAPAVELQAALSIWCRRPPDAAESAAALRPAADAHHRLHPSG